MSRRRVVITGMGIVSPLGCDLNRFWERLVKGQSGIRRMQSFDASLYTSQIAGEVVEFAPEQFLEKKELRHMDPFCTYGIAAAKMAVADSGLDFSKEDPLRSGVVIGTGVGGLQVLIHQMDVLRQKGPHRFSPFMIPQMLTNILAGHVAIKFNLQGPNFCLVSACATATHSMGESLRMIQHGEADVMLAGGSEAPLCELGVGGFCAMKALSTRNQEPEKASRPFDRDRDGFVIAEGAGVLVLEEYEHARQRGARIYCELAGYGRTCDAYHITAPHVEGEGAFRAMDLAMRDAGLAPTDIQHVNPHATSTLLGDRCETKAIKRAFGEDHARKLSLSATKSILGHALAAAGGLEAVACVMTMRHGVVHPTVNLDHPDDGCDLDYVPHTAREMKVKACLKNSFGFGGHNATLCFKALE